MTSRRFTDHFPVGILAECIPRDDVEEAIDRSGTREKRSRLLPSRIVVYYVIALGLFFGESYDEVMRRLVNGLQFLGGWLPSWHVPTPSAITQARKRLGEEPFKVLFQLTAKPLASSATPSAWFHGQRVLAIDGVVLDAPDSPENAEAFGYSVGGKGKARIRECVSWRSSNAGHTPWCTPRSARLVLPNGPKPGASLGHWTREPCCSPIADSSASHSGKV